MKMFKVIQMREDIPNPITSMSGYEPTTDYWAKALRMVNSGIESQAHFEADKGFAPDKKTVQGGMDTLIELEIFPDEQPHTAVEWAEFVMSINHVLWLLNDAPKDKYVNLMLEILDHQYYKWHNKALSTLKDDDLSTYLRITD
jgi:hypothetical protein